jgi:hypothetical protein
MIAAAHLTGIERTTAEAEARAKAQYRHAVYQHELGYVLQADVDRALAHLLKCQRERDACRSDRLSYTGMNTVADIFKLYGAACQQAAALETLTSEDKTALWKANAKTLAHLGALATVVRFNRELRGPLMAPTLVRYRQEWGDTDYECSATFPRHQAEQFRRQPNNPVPLARGSYGATILSYVPTC